MTVKWVLGGMDLTPSQFAGLLVRAMPAALRDLFLELHLAILIYCYFAQFLHIFLLQYVDFLEVLHLAFSVTFFCFQIVNIIQSTESF